MIVTEIVIARHGNAVCNAAGLVGGPATCTGPLTPVRKRTRRISCRRHNSFMLRSSTTASTRP